jgi:serpin B
VALALAGCLNDLPTKTSDSPYADRESVAERVARTNELASRLYHQLAETEGNLLVSPPSIAVCAAMAYAGAQGSTKHQMTSALCFWHSQADFHATMKALNDTLLGRGADQGPDAFRLSFANGCWGADYWPYSADYLNLLLVQYGAVMQMLDFAGHPDESLETINQWVADHTEGRVQNLLPPGSIDASTYLVLATTIWLRASWLHQFDPEYTSNREFTLLDGTSIQLPTMEGEEVFPYREFEGFRAVELPYVGDAVSMYLILPDAGQFATFEAGFDSRRLDDIVEGLVPRGIWLGLPKFSFESAFDLVATLQSLGMVDAFGPGANFTGMDGVDDGVPWISEAVHKTFISVDEYGTEAAAGMGMCLTVGEHPVFRANRPFIFIIRDKPTGTILFLGRVLDPRG